MADDLTERVARAYPDGPRDTAALLNHKRDMRRAFADGARSERRAVADDVDGIAGALWPIEEFEFTWAEAVREAANHPDGYYAAMVRNYRAQAGQVAAHIRGDA